MVKKLRSLLLALVAVPLMYAVSPAGPIADVSAACNAGGQYSFTSNGGSETFVNGTCNSNGFYQGNFKSNDGSCKYVDIASISFSPPCSSSSSYVNPYSFTGSSNSLRICFDAPGPICGSWFTNTGF